MFTKKTIRDIDLNGTRILLRADYNVPVKDGVITDDYRIKQSLPTIQYLLDHGCRVVICSHLGRPDGKVDSAFSLRPVAARLQELLHREVPFADSSVGDDIHERVWKMERSELLLLENLRFHAEEEQNDDEFGRKLASLCEVFVQDGFGVVHRAHASTDAVTRYVYSIAGLLLEREVDTITRVMESPERPLMAVIGGAKIADKIEIIHRFIDMADFVAIGGAMANTFLAAEGIDVAKSKYDAADVATAKDILAKARKKSRHQPFVFYLPQDGVAATSLDKTAKTRIVDWDAHVIADIQSYPKKPSERQTRIHDDEMILDIGPFSGAFIAGGIQLAKTVVWNGTMGVTETPSLQGSPVGPFAHGTDTIVEAMLGQFGNKPFTVVGGGDTVGYVESQDLVQSFGHVSTGGGASLELMAGRTLPGVAALQDR
jgi:3-phosphoglycerate kinase